VSVIVTSTSGSRPIVATPTQPVLVTVPQGKKGQKGDKGDPGQDALWDSMTQAQFDALELEGTLDPNTLYIIID
jgi:hypothetical protein